VRRRPFDPIHDERQRSTFVRREDHVYVVGHDDGALEPVSDFVVVNAARKGDVARCGYENFTLTRREREEVGLFRLFEVREMAA
jgi:hypothetical protein